jgi:hypothetical protein
VEEESILARTGKPNPESCEDLSCQEIH